jgi:hypothetical protein
MRTPKENFRNSSATTTRSGWAPVRVLQLQSGGLPYLLDAVALAHNRTLKEALNVRDAWGVVWDWPEDQPGPTPNHQGPISS